MKKERLYPEELEDSGYYYFMIESAELAEKILYILKDRKCASNHRETMERMVISKLCAVPCYKFMDMPPFEKAMFIANGVSCSALLSGHHVNIVQCSEITQEQAEIIGDVHEVITGTAGTYYHRYLLSQWDFERPYVNTQKAVAYYRKKGLL